MNCKWNGFWIGVFNFFLIFIFDEDIVIYDVVFGKLEVRN